MSLFLPERQDLVLIGLGLNDGEEAFILHEGYLDEQSIPLDLHLGSLKRNMPFAKIFDVSFHTDGCVIKVVVHLLDHFVEELRLSLVYEVVIDSVLGLELGGVLQ